MIVTEGKWKEGWGGGRDGEIQKEGGERERHTHTHTYRHEFAHIVVVFRF